MELVGDTIQSGKQKKYSFISSLVPLKARMGPSPCWPETCFVTTPGHGLSNIPCVFPSSPAAIIMACVTFSNTPPSSLEGPYKADTAEESEAETGPSYSRGVSCLLSECPSLPRGLRITALKHCTWQRMSTPRSLSCHFALSVCEHLPSIFFRFHWSPGFGGCPCVRAG